jgi:hypothetical protein
VADLSFYLTKRDYLYDPKATPAKLAQAGRTLLEREAFSDALDFFERARDAAGLQAIKTISLERGDSFLLARLERFDRKLVSEQDWQAVAVTAERNGMPSMAKFARKRLAPPEAAVKPGVQPLEEAPATEKK